MDTINILLVDDKLENLLALQKYLQRPGVICLTAGSGNEALALTLEKDPALVLLDLQMPDMDGLEIARLLNDNPETMHIPIIFITADNIDAQRCREMYEAGAVDYIAKPPVPTILKRKVNVFISLHRQRQKLAQTNRELKNAINRIREQQKAVIEEERLKLLLQMTGASAGEIDQPLHVMRDIIAQMEIDQGDCNKMSHHLEVLKNTHQNILTAVNKIHSFHTFIPSSEDDTDNAVNTGLPHTLSIFLVEDSGIDFRILKTILKREPHITLHHGTTISESIETIAEGDHDLVLLDYLLPDGTAFDFLRLAEEKKLDVPISVITGQGDEMVASQLIQAGAYDYLPKNKLTLQSLMRVITNTMEKAGLKRELQKARQRMIEMSHVDSLTLLYNRRYFMETLEREFARAARYKTQMILAMMDIDFFKDVNDTYGHPCGDLVLAGIGEILKNNKRTSDTAGRYGGEEFALILPGITMSGAATFCEKIRAIIFGKHFHCGEKRFQVSVSIGFAASFTAESPEKLLEQADKCLYKAKHTGRNRVVAHLSN